MKYLDFVTFILIGTMALASCASAQGENIYYREANVSCDRIMEMHSRDPAFKIQHATAITNCAIMKELNLLRTGQHRMSGHVIKGDILDVLGRSISMGCKSSIE